MNVKITQDNNISFIEVTNDKKTSVTLCTLGASFYRFCYDGKNRIMTPVNTQEFYNNEQYYGKLLGRYSGRIQDAKCTILDKEYTLSKNWNGINALHGGPKGISFSNFSYDILEEEDYIDVEFTYLDMEDELPGDLSIKATYRIMRFKDEVLLTIVGYTNKTTLCNISNHAYWTLSGGEDLVLDEELELNCDLVGDLDQNLIAKKIEAPRKVMDFRVPHKIGDFIEDPYLQNHTSFGYDHFYLKSEIKDDFMARLHNAKENVTLTIRTSYPSVVVYTDNYPTKMKFENVEHEEKYQSIALECQYVPNGIHMDGVKNCILNPKEKYSEYILYSFE